MGPHLMYRGRGKVVKSPSLRIVLVANLLGGIREAVAEFRLGSSFLLQTLIFKGPIARGCWGKLRERFVSAASHSFG